MEGTALRLILFSKLVGRTGLRASASRSVAACRRVRSSSSEFGVVSEANEAELEAALVCEAFEVDLDWVNDGDEKK